LFLAKIFPALLLFLPTNSSFTFSNSRFAMPTPFLGLRTTIYKVTRTEKAKEWYSRVLWGGPV